MYCLMLFTGPECDESEITFSYENVTCTTVGSRKNCQVNCINGYVFYEDPTLSTISLFCENGAWSREPPICTGMVNVIIV